jgi:hypothetical protein
MACGQGCITTTDGISNNCSGCFKMKTDIMGHTITTGKVKEQ